MTIEDIFADLIKLDEANIRSIKIDENGIYQYLFNTPTMRIDVLLADNNRYTYTDNLYVIPRYGDILLSVEVKGKFTNATLFQYNYTGTEKIIYCNITQPGVCTPFPYSGFPLLQIGKNIYMEVEGATEDVNVVATYAYLDTVSRTTLATYETKDQNGVKAVHANQTIYQVMSLNDHGYSPNCFHPIT
jgi:hypothetical protein